MTLEWQGDKLSSIFKTENLMNTLSTIGICEYGIFDFLNEHFGPLMLLICSAIILTFLIKLVQFSRPAK